MAYSLLGHDFAPPDVRAKVTGQAKYAEDFRADGMLHCRMLTSSWPPCRNSRARASSSSSPQPETTTSPSSRASQVLSLTRALLLVTR